MSKPGTHPRSIRLRTAIEQGGYVAVIGGAGGGVRVSWDPRLERDDRPWRAYGANVRYASYEVEAYGA